MSRAFEELDHQRTPMGDLVLRRRLEPTLQVDVFEVKLGEEFLMSSLFTAAEEQLAHLALDVLPAQLAPFDVVVGGLGLGHTAAAALDHPEVGRLDVIDALAPVIDWHRRGLVPLGRRLSDDPRCRFHHADFFARAGGPPPMVPDGPERYHAVLVDIDHTPAHHLHGSHAGFYTRDALRALVAHLHPGGVFALWSDDPPDGAYLELLATELADVEGHLVEFPNPLTGGTGSNSVYLGRCPARE